MGDMLLTPLLGGGGHFKYSLNDGKIVCSVIFDIINVKNYTKKSFPDEVH